MITGIAPLPFSLKESLARKSTTITVEKEGANEVKSFQYTCVIVTWTKCMNDGPLKKTVLWKNFKKKRAGRLIKYL